MNAPFSPPHTSEQCSVETLYIENHAWLRSWLAYRLRSWGRGVADDLAHDIFLRVLTSRHDVRAEPIRQPRAYLTRIATCVLVSWRRCQSLGRAWLGGLMLLPEPGQPSPPGGRWPGCSPARPARPRACSFRSGAPMRSPRPPT